MRSTKVKKVVTSFIRNRGRILLLRRSKKVGSYQGKWAGVSGYLEEGNPLAQALKEIHEETGLCSQDVELVNSGPPLEVVDLELATCWLVHPFLFDTSVPEKIRLDWEHVELQWVKPEMLKRLPTVPKLADAYENCFKKGEENI